MIQFRKAGWLVCLATLAFSAKPAWAAEDKLTGGVEVGVNLTTARIGGTDGTGVHSSVLTGLMVGGTLQYAVTDVVSIQPEFQYTQKYFKIYGTGFNQNEHLDVFELPVLLRLNIPHGKSGPGFYAVMGPGFGYNLRVRETKVTDGGKSQPDRTNNADFNKARYSIIGGAGITTGKVDFEARYESELRNLLNGNPDTGNTTARDHGVTVLLRFNFKKK